MRRCQPQCTGTRGTDRRRRYDGRRRRTRTGSARDRSTLLLRHVRSRQPRVGRTSSSASSRCDSTTDDAMRSRSRWPSCEMRRPPFGEASSTPANQRQSRTDATCLFSPRPARPCARRSRWRSRGARGEFLGSRHRRAASLREVRSVGQSGTHGERRCRPACAGRCAARRRQRGRRTCSMSGRDGAPTHQSGSYGASSLNVPVFTMSTHAGTSSLPERLRCSE